MADNVFSKTIPDLQRWQAGQPVSARMLNKRDDAIKALYSGPDAPSQVVRDPRVTEPEETTKIGAVVAVQPGTTEFVVIQFVKRDNDGNIVDDGESQLVQVWPDRINEDYRRLIGIGALLPIVKVLGVWYVQHDIRFTLAVPTMPRGSCVG